MRPTFWQRVKERTCKLIGHRPDGDPTPRGWQFCRRCLHLVPPKESR